MTKKISIAILGGVLSFVGSYSLTMAGYPPSQISMMTSSTTTMTMTMMLGYDNSFMRSIELGGKNQEGDVRRLQELLATDPSIYPEGKITGFFGALTKKAVGRLQEKLGLENVGRVGPKTMEKLNQLLTEGAGKSGKIPPGLLMNHGKSVMLPILAQNNSGLNGVMSLAMGANGTTRVIVELPETYGNMAVIGTSSVPRPMHIHLGTCATIGAVKYPLTALVNGRSETLLNVSLPDLLKDLPLALNVHKSSAEVGVYIACGDLRAPNVFWDTKKVKNDDDRNFFEKMEMGAKGRHDEEKKMMPMMQSVIGTPQSVKTFDIATSNYQFSVTNITVKKGDLVKINLKGSDALHDLVIDELGVHTDRIQSGQLSSVVFTANKVGTFEYYCSVGSHRAMGMVGKITVTE